MAELEKYFGKEATPAKMKEQIMTLLDEWKEKQPPELAKARKRWKKTSNPTTLRDKLSRGGPAPPAKLCGDISPVAAYLPVQPGVGRQGCNAPPLAAACPLRSAPLCYFQRRGGGIYILQSRPLSMTGKGRGDWAEVSFFNEWRFDNETATCLYYRRMAWR